MIYDISEEGQPDSKELIEELSTGAFKGPDEELEEELTGNPTTESDIVDQIRDAAEKDNVVQRITGAVRAGQRKLPQAIIKDSQIKLELGDYTIEDDVLYVNQRLYVPNNPELKTKIIKSIHDTPPRGHAGRSSTYDRLSTHYY